MSAYLVTLNKKVSKVCRHEADLLSFCINHLYDFTETRWHIVVEPILPDGRIVDKQYLYGFTWCPYWLDYKLEWMTDPTTKPFANRKGSFVSYIIE